MKRSTIKDTHSKNNRNFTIFKRFVAGNRAENRGEEGAVHTPEFLTEVRAAPLQRELRNFFALILLGILKAFLKLTLFCEITKFFDFNMSLSARQNMITFMVRVYYLLYFLQGVCCRRKMKDLLHQEHLCDLLFIPECTVC
jgi:hypothetical protein